MVWSLATTHNVGLYQWTASLKLLKYCGLYSQRTVAASGRKHKFFMMSLWDFYQLCKSWQDIHHRGAGRCGLPYRLWFSWTCPGGTSYSNLCLQTQAVSVRCGHRPQHLRGLREAICGQEATTVRCGQRPQQFKNH